MASTILLAILSTGMLCSVFSGTLSARASATIDWWSMFHHDLSHSGYSTSTAPNTNQTLWKYTTGDEVGSSPAVANGIVYVGSNDNRTYALNATTGALIWKYKTGDMVSSSPAVANGIVYVGSWDNNVYALNATTGALAWKYTTGGPVHSSPAVANGIVYVGSYDNRTYALNATTGALVWKYKTGDTVFSSPAVANGIVYVGSYDDNVYALNATTGALVWKYKTGALVSSSPAVANGIVYVGSWDNNVYALNATTGALVWKYKTGYMVSSSPAVANGFVYVGSYDNRTYALIAATGTLVWKYKTGDEVSSSPAVANGIVYVGSLDYGVYAFGVLCLPVSISPGSVVMDVGQSQLFASTVSLGTPPYSYQWYLNGVPVSGATSDTWTFTPSSAGSYTVYTKVTDAADVVETSNTATVTVNPAPSVSVSPASVVMDFGQSQLFASSVSGGTSPFSYQWYLNGAPVSGATNPSWTFTPSSAGSYTVYLNVTDVVGAVATSNTATVTVNGALSVTISPSSVTLDVGQSQVFNSSVLGGTSPYSYQWYLNGVAQGKSSSWTFTPSSSGSYSVYINVTDSVGVKVKSNVATITVNPALSVSILPTSVTMDVGQSQLFNSTVSGGTSPYHYQWYLNGAAVLGATGAAWTFTPTSTGSYTLYLEVADSLGASGTSPISNVTVNPQPTVAISPSNTTIYLGESQLLTSSVSGGVSPFSYQWYFNGAPVSDATGTTWTPTPSSAGSYTVYVEVTDGVGAKATSNTATITVYGGLSVSVSPASVIMGVGQYKLFTSTVFGGTSPYSYQWYLNGVPVSGAKSVTWAFPPSSAGSYTVYVEVTDGVGAKATSNTATITRALHYVAATNVTPSKTFLFQGFSMSINVTVTNQGSYTETFKVTVYANATSIASQNITLAIENSATTTFIWNTAGFARGSYTIKVQVALAPGETNTANNTYTGGWVEVRLRGDVNGDGKVNLADFGKLKLIYSEVYPYLNPPYDVIHPELYYYLPSVVMGKPEYLMPDINGDGVVSFADVGKLKLIYSGYFP